jgi:hypothetical protein
MFKKVRQKCRQMLIEEVGLANRKVNPVYLTVNGADAQSRQSGILFAQANGKLYFECLKIFSAPENTCPCRGRKILRSRIF